MSELAAGSIVVSPAMRELVLGAYRSARSSTTDPQGKFNAALIASCDAHPDVEAPEARRAVARLIASADSLV